MTLRTTAHVLSEMELPDDGVISIEVRCRMDLLGLEERHLVEALFDLMGATVPTTADSASTSPGVDDEGAGESAEGSASSAPTRSPDPAPEPDEPELPPAAAAPAKRASARNAPTDRRSTEDSGIILLRGLHELGGEIVAPDGRAMAALLDHVAWDRSTANATKVIAVLADAGHISRTVNGRRTTRIALQPSGLAVLDRAADATDAEAAAEQLDGDLGPTAEPEPSEHPACPRCHRTFKGQDVAKRLRQHLVTAHGVSETEAQRMVREVA